MSPNTNNTIQTSYQPENIESSIYKIWEDSGYFSPDYLKNNLNKNNLNKPYCIMLPPPNVTGSLHMGHGFQDTLMDILIRYHRMMGAKTLWQAGTDHAGIATQMVVERQLEALGSSREKLGREAFIQKVFEWKEISGGNILRQMRRLGASCDWESERFTMDEGLSKAVQTVFIKLYEENLIYKGTRLVNWDPKLQTAVSDLEVISTPEAGFLWHIAYPLSNPSNPSNQHDDQTFITVATTRPETLLGDVAVAVNPEDPRYKNLIGQYLNLPLTNKKIPIISDHYVDPSFGSGAVKITPAHDFNDYEVGKRHGLDPINIFNLDASLNNNTPEKYQGLDRFEARKLILKDLENLGLLIKTEPHTLSVPRAERGNTIIEPRLSPQWYVKIKPLAEPAMEAVKSGKIKLVPDNAQNLYFRWMEDIQDWCISRQLWWGHRIPAWYDLAGNIYVGESESQVRDKYQLDKNLILNQDNDVLDTWFSSALWPFSTLGWPEKTERFEQFYPTSVLVTGFDILFFWVARMIMFGLKFTGQVPFQTVYLHGLIRDHEGQKMSKTKGNVLDPVDLIDGISLENLIAKRTDSLMIPSQKEKIIKSTKKQFPEGIKSYGCDALRLTYAALASTSRDIIFDVARLDGYRNFCNKLFNATRYVLMNLSGDDVNLVVSPLAGETDLKAAPKVREGENYSKSFSLADHWIFSKLNQCIEQTHQSLADFRFDHYIENIYSFVWGDYCDWYLELSKVILNQDYSEKLKDGTRYTLIYVLKTILKLLHPVMPFLTEHLWETVSAALPLPSRESSRTLSEREGVHEKNHLILQSFPQSSPENSHPHACNTMDWLKELITQIRTIRSELNLNPKQIISLKIENALPEQWDLIQELRPYLTELCKIDKQSISIFSKKSEQDLNTAHATACLGNITLHVPITGLIDLNKEKERLNKNIEKLDAQINQLEQKLSRPDFIDKAPEQIIQKEKERLNLLQNEKSSALEQLKKLGA